MHPRIEQRGTIPVVHQDPAYAWFCTLCPARNVAFRSEREALGDAADHYWEEHEIALCQKIGDLIQFGHPGHRWQHIKFTDSCDECERCHTVIGK